MSNVVSADTLLASRSGLTGRWSMPAAPSRRALDPPRRTAGRGLLRSLTGGRAIRRKPSLARRAPKAGRRPREGHRSSAKNSGPLLSEHREAARLVEFGCGLGRNLLAASPTETVMPISRSTSAANAQGIGRPRGHGGAVCPTNRERPRRWTTAPQAESGPASLREPAGPPRHICACWCLITTASGQSARALNMGMAERTPLMRAM